MAKRIKSRYKICFQTKNKVWIYKNSRLRNFYKIRNKIVLKQGKFAKQFLVTKNMKWTVARRFMVPYFRMRNRFKFQYKNMLFNKQQLKNFYGGLKEYQIRNIFKKTWNTELFYRRNIFVSALEQRLNVVLYRMKLLPTIYASTQLIRHQGILVNNVLITLPSFRVNLGEIISIPEMQWNIFYDFLIERLKNRFFGQCILIWRKERSLKSIHFARLRNRQFFLKNMDLMDYFAKIYLFFQKIRKKLFKTYFIYQSKKFQSKFVNNNLNINIEFIQEIFNAVDYKKKLIFLENLIYKIFPLSKILKNLNKMWFRFRAWGRPIYIEYIKNYIKKFSLIFNLLKETEIELKIFNKNSYFEMKLFLLYQYYFKQTKNVKLSKKQYILFKELYDEFSEYKNFLIESSESILMVKALKNEISTRNFFLNFYKKSLYLPLKTFSILNRKVKYLIRQFKYRKKKRKTFKNWCKKIHWYIPRYLEVDFRTLRSIFVYYPEGNEISFGFLCSFNKLISFYKERSL